jgi:hypothetical protein
VQADKDAHEVFKSLKLDSVISFIDWKLYLADQKPARAIIVDNGADYAPMSLGVAFSMGRLWQALELDLLILVSYAAGYSAMNPIERRWAKVTDACKGFKIPDHLPDTVW